MFCREIECQKGGQKSIQKPVQKSIENRSKKTISKGVTLRKGVFQPQFWEFSEFYSLLKGFHNRFYWFLYEFAEKNVKVRSLVVKKVKKVSKTPKNRGSFSHTKYEEKRCSKLLKKLIKKSIQNRGPKSIQNRGGSSPY